MILSDKSSPKIALLSLWSSYFGHIHIFNGTLLREFLMNFFQNKLWWLLIYIHQRSLVDFCKCFSATFMASARNKNLRFHFGRSINHDRIVLGFRL